MARRRAIPILIACAVAFCFYRAYQADQSSRATATPAEIATSQIIGTWRADTGSIFQFRENGTARSRDPSEPQLDVNYFEWETDGDEFVVRMAPRGTIKRALARVSGMQEDVFRLQDLTDNGFTLLEPDTTSVFVRTMDTELDEAP